MSNLSSGSIRYALLAHVRVLFRSVAAVLECMCFALFKSAVCVDHCCNLVDGIVGH